MPIIIGSAESVYGAVGYRNLMEEGGITASSQTTGYEAVNAATWTTYNKWLPTAGGLQYLTCTLPGAETASYFAVYGHDLGAKGGSVQLQYSTDGSTWSNATDPVAPSGTQVVFKRFSAILAQYWRFKVSTPTDAAYIAVAAFGPALEFPQGWRDGFQPPLLNDYRDTTHQSEGGNFIGRSVVADPLSLQIRVTALDPAWVREHWVPFRRHAEAKPFFVSWDAVDHPFEAAYCWTQGKQPQPQYDDYVFMSVGLSVEGWVE